MPLTFIILYLIFSVKNYYFIIFSQHYRPYSHLITHNSQPVLATCSVLAGFATQHIQTVAAYLQVDVGD